MWPKKPSLTPTSIFKPNFQKAYKKCVRIFCTLILKRAYRECVRMRMNAYALNLMRSTVQVRSLKFLLLLLFFFFFLLGGIFDQLIWLVDCLKHPTINPSLHQAYKYPHFPPPKDPKFHPQWKHYQNHFKILSEFLRV